jgi:alpha-beta hydrolase superfamily lysophospholipase
MNTHVQYNSSDGVKLDTVIRESPSASVTVLMLHGINSDKDEGGLYVRLANQLDNQKYNILRFDFRCHGNSSCPTQYMTIQGETDDLIHTLAFAQKRWPDRPIAIVAASFGTVSVLNAVSHDLFRSVRGIALLNPVLNVQETFLSSSFEWPHQSFNEDAYARLATDGYFQLDHKIKIGQQLFDEMHHVKPYENLGQIDVPILIIHGDADCYVSYSAARKYASLAKNCTFMTIQGANHGFRNPDEERQVIDAVRTWLDQTVQ